MVRRAVVIALAVLAVVPASASAQQLAATWCGTPTEANNADPTNAPRLKYVYAHPADKPNRFDDAAYRNALQGDAKSISDFFSSAAGGRKALRWDTGTSCGSQYVDIEVVKLPGNQSDYVPDTNSKIERARADLRAAIDPAPGRRDYLVQMDLTRRNGSTDLAGIAQSADDDKPGMVNSANRGNRITIAYATDNFTGASYSPALRHEVLHAFGAVNNSAPHSDKFGHATDGADILGASSGVCPGSAYGTLDCNQDDYFNPAPAPGSYLATHWNVYDVVFFVAPDQVGAQAAPPVAMFTGTVGSTAALDASTSADPDGIVTKYEWDIGGDGSYESTTATPTTSVARASNDTYGLRVTDEDGLTATASMKVAPGSSGTSGGPGGSEPGGTGTPGGVVDLGLKSTKTSQKLKDAQKKGVLAKAKPTAAGKLTFTLYKGKKKLKSVKANAKAGKTVSERIKLSSRVRKKYLKKASYEIRASLAPTGGGTAVTAKIKVKLK